MKSGGVCPQCGSRVRVTTTRSIPAEDGRTFVKRYLQCCNASCRVRGVEVQWVGPPRRRWATSVLP